MLLTVLCMFNQKMLLVRAGTPVRILNQASARPVWKVRGKYAPTIPSNLPCLMIIRRKHRMITSPTQSCSKGVLHCCQTVLPLNPLMQIIILFVNVQYILVFNGVHIGLLLYKHLSIFLPTPLVAHRCYLLYNVSERNVFDFAWSCTCAHLCMSIPIFPCSRLIFLQLIWRLFLRCIGLGHPSQNSQMIKADIGKLPKNLVDRIPLVVYIPTPPNASPTEEPKQMPTSIYSYSPKSPVEGMEISAKKCFRFIEFHQFSSKFNKTTNDGPTGSLKQVNLTESGFWEESWDTGGYPHIVLDDNRAACAICLLDFEEPKRLHVVAEEQSKGGQVTVEVISEEKYENDELRSVDVREGAQLLRLLGCGHVFHVRA